MYGLARNEVIGVDIGTTAVKIAQLRKTAQGWLVTSAGIAGVPEGPQYDKHPPEARSIRAIGDCLQLTRTRSKSAVCGISGPEVTVRGFKLASLPPEEIGTAVFLEAVQVCPFNTEDIAVDYELIPGDQDKTTGFLVAATNKLLKSHLRLAKKAHLNCVLMDVDGLALLNCFNEIEKPKPGPRTAILNIGSSHATLAIESENSLPFVRDLTYAGDSIIKQIADENDMSPGAVKTVLYGDSEENPPEVHQSLHRACERLIDDITKTVRYYEVQERRSDVQKIFICGGFALVQGLVEFLNSRLPIEAVLWNPFDKIDCHVSGDTRSVLRKHLLQKNGPAMAVAAGLAMRSI